MTPIDEWTQGAVAVGTDSIVGSQQPRRVLQASGDLLRRQHAGAAAAHSMASGSARRRDPRHDFGVPIGEPKRRVRRGRPVDEEADRASARSVARAAATGSAASGPGKARGLGCQTASPATLSRSRLVTMSASRGQPESRVTASSAQADTTASQPSSTSSPREPPTAAPIDSSTGPSGSAPTTFEMDWVSDDPSRSVETSACHTREANRTDTVPATSTASRDLPTPPGPVRVSSRAPRWSRERTASTSTSRPMNEVNGTGGASARRP